MGKRSRDRRKSDQQARTAHAGGRAPKAGPTASRPRVPRGHGGVDDFEFASSLVINLLRADDEGTGAEFAEANRALERGCERMVDGPRTVDRAFQAIFENLLASLWAAGWQPADVARLVSRELGVREARLAVTAIASQMRRYPAQTVDERWEAQLRSLGADVWWADDETWLGGWGDREQLDRGSVVLAVVRVLNLLVGLPVLPTLCPPPGTARRRAGRPAHATGDLRVLDRVRALLAKAESTEFTEEADALTAKAQQLIAQHSIDEAMLAAAAAGDPGSADEPGGLRIGVDNPYDQSKALLLDAVASANRCKAVWMKAFGFSTVVGFPSDLDAVELLYTSLLVQATSAMTREGSKQDRYGRSRTRTFRQSFLTAFATRIGERLTAATDEASEQAATATGRDRLLPVLAARTEAVDDTTEAMFPRMVAKAVSANDAEGRASGRAAADLASLRTREEVAAC